MAQLATEFERSATPKCEDFNSHDGIRSVFAFDGFFECLGSFYNISPLFRE